MAAQGKTRLQIVNAVLTRLREATVATTSSTTYAALIAGMVDAVKTEIEQAHMWRDLRNSFTITAVPGTTLYTFTSSGQGARILDMWNSTTKAFMYAGSFHDFNQKFFGTLSVATGNPSMYLPAGLDASYDLQVDIWPSPATTNTLLANLYVPQLDLSSDTDVPLIPNQALIEGTLAMAYAERGDDNGTQAQAQRAYYEMMLQSAIAHDAGHDTSEMAWVVV